MANTECVDCGRAMRSRKRSLAERPGTVRYVGQGRCKMCYNRAFEGAKPRVPVPPQCTECRRPMRRSRTAPDGVTVEHKTGGRCIRCCYVEITYGMTSATWHVMLVDQAGRCAVCSDPMSRPVVDHCHSTGHVRALLCDGCNTAEGLLRSDPIRARALADYLDTHRAVVSIAA